MTEYTFTDNELNDLQALFFLEAYEILESLDHEILSLETGDDRAAALRNMQRHFHTLKGNSRALGFTDLNKLTHTAEDLLKAIQDSDRDIDQQLIDLLLAVSDQLQSLLDGHKNKCGASLDENLLVKIDETLRTCTSSSSKGKKPETAIHHTIYDVSLFFDADTASPRSEIDQILQKIGLHGDIVFIDPQLDSDRIDHAGRVTIRLAAKVPPDTIKESIAFLHAGKKAEITIPGSNGGKPQQQGIRTPAGGAGDTNQSLRVDAVRIDKILNLVGELVIGRSMVGQALLEISDRYKNDDRVKKLAHANSFMEKILSQLQKNVMKIRMHPIARIFKKFPRVIRDLASEQKKQVELVMEGEKTELDKSILDVIGEPLIHLIRNAVDHGIEPPVIRERTGKPATGKVTLHAHHESNQIVIQVADDGKGLDPDLLRKKAVQKGIKTAEETARMNDDEALDMIFLSGFSTAEIVTDISGRGYGMDIVRTTVESLKGKILVSSVPGEGTTFTLRLPLTLAIIRAMLFWVEDRLLALPLSSIEKITRVSDRAIQFMTGKKVTRYRDKVISLISLEETLNIRPQTTGRTDSKKYIIIVGLGDKLYGFLVDRLFGQEELVIKALDNHWGTINCTSGASILGDGRVVLILDAPSIILKEVRREFARSSTQRDGYE